jgi:hypothetical protein
MFVYFVTFSSIVLKLKWRQNPQSVPYKQSVGVNMAVDAAHSLATNRHRS